MKKTTTKTRKKVTQKVNRQADISQEELRGKVEKYMSAENDLLQKHGLAKRLVISFPYGKGKIPFLGRMGQKLLTWSNAVIDSQFGVIKK